MRANIRLLSVPVLALAATLAAPALQAQTPQAPVERQAPRVQDPFSVFVYDALGATPSIRMKGGYVVPGAAPAPVAKAAPAAPVEPRDKTAVSTAVTAVAPTR